MRERLNQFFLAIVQALRKPNEVDNETIQIGALVDAVQAVIEIDKAKIMPPPSIGSKYRSEFIEEVASIDEKFITILNMDAVFSTEDVTDLKIKTEETECNTSVEEVG